MSELQHLLDEHNAAPWQTRWNGEDAAGVPLNLIDPDIVGLVQVVARGKTLSPDQVRMLRELKVNASAVVAAMPAADKPYFERLERLALMALEVNG